MLIWVIVVAVPLLLIGALLIISKTTGHSVLGLKIGYFYEETENGYSRRSNFVGLSLDIEAEHDQHQAPQIEQYQQQGQKARPKQDSPYYYEGYHGEE